MSEPLYLSADEIRKISAYCAEEVRRQGEKNPFYVGTMIDAYLYGMEMQYAGRDISVDLIETLGRKVKPDTNKDGFRTIPIYINGPMGSQQKAPPSEIAGRLERWVALLPDMTALEAYREFEEIHPFADGNGRTGKIILNWENGSFYDPIFPPKNFWGLDIENP